MAYTLKQKRAMWYHEKAHRIEILKARGLWDAYREYRAGKQYDCITGFYNHIKIDERTGEPYTIIYKALIYYGGDHPTAIFFRTRRAARELVSAMGNGNIYAMRANAERVKYLDDSGASWAYIQYWRIPLGSGVTE